MFKGGDLVRSITDIWSCQGLRPKACVVGVCAFMTKACRNLAEAFMAKMSVSPERAFDWASQGRFVSNTDCLTKCLNLLSDFSIKSETIVYPLAQW